MSCRYAIVHKYGGVYTDADTECRSAITHWLPDDCQVGLALENVSRDDRTHKLNNEWFCQWTFGAVPQHPLIASALQLVQSRVEAGTFNTDDPGMVHKTTGPAAWTEGVLAYLSTAVGPPVQVGDNLTEWVQDNGGRARQQGICLYTHAELQQSSINHYASTHHKIRPRDVRSWVAQRDALLPYARVSVKPFRPQKERSAA